MPSIFPRRVQDVRKRNNMSQERLAKKADMGKRQIQRIESSNDEQVTVHETTLQGIAKALRVSPGVLTGDEAMPEGPSTLGSSKGKTSAVVFGSAPEVYEARLIKLDDAYAVVEFSRSNPVGNIIARDIPNEAAGGRLTSYPSVREWLKGALEWTLDSQFEGEKASWSDWELLLLELDHALRPTANDTASANASMSNTAPEHAFSGGKVDQ